MAVTHPTSVRNEIADLIVDGLDGGSLVYLTAADAEVATCGFGTPAAGAAAAGTATFNAITQDASATGGTIAKAELRTSGAAARVLCSVTAVGGGGDIEATSLTVAATEPVDTTALSYTACA